jgi:hypothetical protein
MYPDDIIYAMDAADLIIGDNGQRPWTFEGINYWWEILHDFNATTASRTDSMGPSDDTDQAEAQLAIILARLGQDWQYLAAKIDASNDAPTLRLLASDADNAGFGDLGTRARSKAQSIDDARTGLYNQINGAIDSYDTDPPENLVNAANAARAAGFEDLYDKAMNKLYGM